MNRLLATWNAYWFPTASTLNLAGARIVAVAAQVFWFFPSLTGQINLVSKNEAFVDPQPLIRLLDALAPRELIFNPGTFTLIYWVTFVAGLLALVGLRTRTSLLLLALGNLFFVSHRYSYADVHHPEALFAIFLLALALAPAGDSLSIDAFLRRRRAGAAGAVATDTSDTAMWPLKLAHVLLAMTYFSTGISKLLSGGLRWMNGYTLQNDIFSDAINRNIPFGIWLAQQRTLCILLSVGTILFEVFFFVSLLLPRTAPLFFLGGILFHVGLYVTSGHPFFQHIVMNAMLLLFLGPDWFPAQVARLRATWGGQRALRQAA